MKTLVAAALIVFASISASFGQGFVNFSNFLGTGSRIHLGDAGTNLPITGYSYALLYGTSASTVTTIAATSSTWSNAGFFNNGALQIAGQPVGTTLYFQLYVWDTNSGATFAAYNTAAFKGQSALWTTTIGNSGGTPPATAPSFTALNDPIYETGIVGFTVTAAAVPEPSTFALAALGGLGLLWRRRRA